MQRMENSYNNSKVNSSANKTVSQNSKIVKGISIFSPTSNLFKTELSKRDFVFDGNTTNTNSNKNNKLRFERFEFDNFDTAKK
jgi:hypothetical protein